MANCELLAELHMIHFWPELQQESLLANRELLAGFCPVHVFRNKTGIAFKPQMLQYFNQFIAGSANIEFITPALIWTAFRCNQPMTYGTFSAMLGGILSTRGALYCDLRVPYLDIRVV